METKNNKIMTNKEAIDGYFRLETLVKEIVKQYLDKGLCEYRFIDYWELSYSDLHIVLKDSEYDNDCDFKHIYIPIEVIIGNKIDEYIDKLKKYVDENYL